MPESPDFSPDGKEVAFSGARRRDRRHLHRRPRDRRGHATSPRTPSATTRRPGRPTASRIVYIARVSGNDKLFSLDLATGTKKQLTFGTHDDSGAQFVDDDTLVFTSTATDPNQPLDAEVARNGNIHNIWTLT